MLKIDCIVVIIGIIGFDMDYLFDSFFSPPINPSLPCFFIFFF